MYVLYETLRKKGCISIFVVGRAAPPMGNRNRTIELSTVPVRAHCPSGGRRYNTIWLRVYDPIFVVSARTCGLYEILRKSEAYFKLCCGQNRIRIRSARGSYIIAAGGLHYELRVALTSLARALMVYGFLINPPAPNCNVFSISSLSEKPLAITAR